MRIGARLFFGALGSALTGVLVCMGGPFAAADSLARDVASIDSDDMNLSTHGSQQPSLYELGLGLGAYVDPHYPGSDQSRTVVMPFPFLIYRGSILQSDHDGTRARLLHGRDYEFTFSGDGDVPLKSSDDGARTGMEDLGWTLQLGPKIQLKLKTWDDGSTLKAGFSVRGVASALDWNSIMGRGYTFQPDLIYDRPNAFGDRFDFSTGLSALFATSKYMDYLYGVGPSDATSTRPSYAAKAGYLETELQAGISYRTRDGRHAFYWGGQVGSLTGSACADSPLVRTKLDYAVGVAWIWSVFESEEKAPVQD